MVHLHCFKCSLKLKCKNIPKERCSPLFLAAEVHHRWLFLSEIVFVLRPQISSGWYCSFWHIRLLNPAVHRPLPIQLFICFLLFGAQTGIGISSDTFLHLLSMDVQHFCWLESSEAWLISPTHSLTMFLSRPFKERVVSWCLTASANVSHHCRVADSRIQPHPRSGPWEGPGSFVTEDGAWVPGRKPGMFIAHILNQRPRELIGQNSAVTSMNSDCWWLFQRGSHKWAWLFL